MKKIRTIGTLTVAMIIICCGVFFCNADTVASGDCGESPKTVVWQLYDKGVLVITGEGKMMDYKDSSPFDEYADMIISIEIADGVTGIGYNAFAQCNCITAVSIPASVTYIPDGSFLNCPNVTIYCAGGSNAHSYAQSNNIPFELTGGGSTVQPPEIPEDIDQESIVESGSCGINGDNTMWCLDDEGTLTVYGSGSMTWYSPYDGSSYGFPDSPFTGLSTYINKIDIREGVTEIGMGAFRKCSNVTAVSIPDTVVRLQDGAFSECSGLATVHIPDDVTYIGNSAFYGCTNLASINLASIRVVTFQSFEFCSSLNNVVIPEGVVRIEGEAFFGCESLETITVPSTVERIGASAFGGCKKISSFSVPDGVETIPDSLFSNCTGLRSVNLPDSINSIEDHAFYGCSSLTGIDLPDNITRIEEYTFANCSSLAALNIPSGVTFIGSGAFSGCAGLQALSLPDGVTDIGEAETFSGCTGLVSFTVPAKVANIGENTFKGCSNLRSITIPDKVTSIGYQAFEGCSKLASFTMPSKVTAIGSAAFKDCSCITGLTIPSGITEIGWNTFENCTKLRTITLSDNLSTIETCAFHNCESLDNVILPAGLTQIDREAFEGCSSLKTILIPDTVNGIDQWSFRECPIVTIVCKDGSYAHNYALDNGFTYSIMDNHGNYDNVIDSTGLYAHGMCGADGNNVKWTLDSKGVLRIIGTGRMKDCKLEGTEITNDGEVFNSNQMEAPYHSWEYREIVKKIIVENSVSYIGDGAFAGCKNAAEIQIADSVTEIGDRVFDDCRKLESIEIPDSVRKIGGIYTFSYCESLTTITWPKTIVVRSNTIGSGAFYHCDSLEAITIPEGVETINSSAVSCCPSLEAVYLPHSLKTIHKAAFDSRGDSRFENLTDVYYAGTEAEWGSISIKPLNDALTNATIHFGYDGSGASNYEQKEVSGILRQSTDWTIRWSIIFKQNSEGKKKDCNLYINLEGGNPDDGNLALYSTLGTGTTMPWLTDEYGFKKTDFNSISIKGNEYNNLYPIVDQFEGYSRVRDLLLQNVSEIEDGSFRNCTKLASCDCDMNLTSIGGNAFAYSGLRSIKLYKTVTSIGEDAFKGCDDLTIACYNNSAALRYALRNNINYVILDPSSMYCTVLGEDFEHDLLYYARSWNSTEYNPELAHLMMTMANAAYDPDDIEQGCTQLGLSKWEPYNYDKYWSVYGTENVCYSISSVADADGTICLLVAIRGSGDIKDIRQGSLDWIGNLDIKSASQTEFSPHENFNAAATHVYEGIDDYLYKKFGKRIGSIKIKYFITGHSRGAAVANLVEYKLDPLGKEDIYGYNFAVPDTGVISEKTNVKGWDNIFNISNLRDPVGYVPGPVVDSMFFLKQLVSSGRSENKWQKWGVSVWFDDGTQKPVEGEAHDPKLYLSVLRERAPISSYTETPQFHPGIQLEITGLKYKVYATYCPVDVELIDENGTVIASVTDGVADYHDTHFGDVIIATVDDHKMIAVPSAANYSLRIIGSDSGTLDYYVAEANMITDDFNLIKSFEGINLSDGKMFISREDPDQSANERLFVVDEDGTLKAEVLENGSETATEQTHTHSFGSWIITIPATEMTPGEQTRTCSECGAVEKETISPLSPTLPAVKITKPKVAGKSATVKWKKISKKNRKKIKSVQIQYSLDRSFNTDVKTTTASAKKTSKKIKIPKGQKYYVRIRALNGNHVSAWSSVKSVKAK